MKSQSSRLNCAGLSQLTMLSHQTVLRWEAYLGVVLTEEVVVTARGVVSNFLAGDVEEVKVCVREVLFPKQHGGAL